MKLSAKKCLNHYPGAHCELCAANCPAKAILSNEIDEKLCNHCGICTAICPTNAIETTAGYGEKLTQLVSDSEIKLYCPKRHSSAKFYCLGFLDRKIIWALISNGAKLSIDLSACENCNPSVYTHLKKECHAVNNAIQTADQSNLPHKLLPVNTDQITDFTDPKIQQQVSRRDFFKAIFSSTLKSIHEASDYMDSAPDTFNTSLWADKNSYILPPIGFSWGVNIDTEKCNTCGMCSMICPSKAISTKENSTDTSFSFNQLLCKNCGLCRINCPNDAINIAEKTASSHFTVAKPICEKCHKPFRPTGNNKLCDSCNKPKSFFSGWF